MRTVTRDDARGTVSRGHVDFRVVSVEPRDNGGRSFIVRVPFTVMRDGLFGPLSNAVGGNGKPTRFGQNLFMSLTQMDGVEPSLDHELPTVITVFISAELTEEPPEGFWNQSHGLPASVCYIIQRQIMQHCTVPRRLMEYVRRAI